MQKTWKNIVQLTDVNVLIYAARRDMPDHVRYKQWLDNLAQQDAAFGMSELVLSGVLRIITNPRAFKKPTPTNTALNFVKKICELPNCVIIQPGQRHWDIFVDLCKHVKARGNVVPDAYFAALAIESGSEWITTDRGFNKFPALRWRHPLDS